MENKFVDSDVRFFGSGSTLLDLALGGGWALPRIFNIVGDKSTGKTLQAIEAFANFKIRFPDGRMRYAEAEAAFDEAYAEILGFPEDVERPGEPIRTVEEFQEDFYKFMAVDTKPCLYILDSLDAVSTETEVEIFEKQMAGERAPGSMGAEKAKMLSKMFKNIAMEMKLKNACLGIISQIRDKIGVTFGETKMRSGGHALDFYCSQVLWLSEIKKVERQAMGIKRITSIEVEGYVKKNKVGLPFRKAQWPLVFGYGVDDEISMLTWLKSNKQVTEEFHKIMSKQLETARDKKDYATMAEVRKVLQADTRRVWAAVEEALSPSIRKYQNFPPPSTPPPTTTIMPQSLKELADEAKEAIDSAVQVVEVAKAVNITGFKQQ